jgi:hypothetical protein
MVNYPKSISSSAGAETFVEPVDGGVKEADASEEEADELRGLYVRSEGRGTHPVISHTGT